MKKVAMEARDQAREGTALNLEVLVVREIS